MMRIYLSSIFLCFAVQPVLFSDDWSTYRHDNRRSGVTPEIPTMPLEQSWVRISPHAPMMAWSGPAKWDAYSGNKDLQSMRNFDPVFFVTVKGKSVFYGSSVDHGVHCLDTDTGKEKWVSFVTGAVRMPPTIDDGLCHFGSDDGYAYAVDSSNGNIKWKHGPAEDKRLISSNGKLISPWPVRTGVLIQNGIAYFAASLVPWESSYLCSVNKKNGEPVYISKHPNMTLQGSLLSSNKTLYAPQGRSVPLLFELNTGKAIKSVANAGGTFCLLTEDDKLVAIPSSQKSSGNIIQITDPSGGSAMLQFAGADRLLISKEIAFIHQQGKLKCLDRNQYSEATNSIAVNNNSIKSLTDKSAKIKANLKKIIPTKDAEKITQIRTEISTIEESISKLKILNVNSQKTLLKSYQWQVNAPSPYDLILAGNIIFMGANDMVIGFDATSGKELWSAKVKGKTYGLAFSGGKLFASTTLGHIYCFGRPSS